MKIAFVGKGGSGKSTMTSLFIRYLQLKAKKEVLAIDADLNMNLSGLLGVEQDLETLLANPEVAESIRAHLKGTNPRVQDTAKFLPTTPPGKGSNIISSVHDAALTKFAANVATNPAIKLLTVGSYESDGIGQTCYHSHLFVAENLLSHLNTSENFAVVCDMVAGTDAFAYSMHLQFDAIVLIAEPTPESVEVCELYLSLAKESGIDESIYIVGNKIADEDDVQFIQQRLGKKLLATVPLMPSLKKTRQQGRGFDTADLDDNLVEAMQAIESMAEKSPLTAATRLQKLHQLHSKLNTKKWVQQGYGDVDDQIDPDFQFPSLQKVGAIT